MLHPTRTFLIALIALLFTTLAPAQNRIVTLERPQPVEADGKIEVLEFFAYGCIHCAHLEPKFEPWIRAQKPDVKVRRVPSPALIRGIDSVTLFYTLEAMGQLDRLHAKLFEAANFDNVMLGNPTILMKWLGENGVDTKKYEEVQKSFAVLGKLARARKNIEDYRVGATPTLIVNGRLSMTPGRESPEEFLKMVDQAIAQSRQGNKAAKP